MSAEWCWPHGRGGPVRAFTSRHACAVGRSGNGKLALVHCESHVAMLTRGLLMLSQGPHGRKRRQDWAPAQAL